jgi:hypothetical protein
MHKNQSQRPISYQHNVKKLNKKKKIKDKQKKLKNQKKQKNKAFTMQINSASSQRAQ